MSDLSLGIDAGAAFDRLAENYDQDFTNSHVGRAQRNEVWKVLLKTFCSGNKILELNCGTGEDAVFLAANGISVFACDASQQMIARANQRLNPNSESAPIIFRQLRTERIDELDSTLSFNGVFSNFSGLNCIEDLRPVGVSLARLLKPGDRLLLCLSTRICLIEILYYLSRGRPTKALRRCSGQANAHLDGAGLTVYYPDLRAIRRSLAPHFRLRSHTGVGVTVPPSYIEPWVRRNPQTFKLLCSLEPYLANLPILRTTGDHMLLCFERVSP